MSSSDVSVSEQGLVPATETPVTTGPTWQDQDGVLREMWLKNQTPNAIAEALGRSVPAIMTRAARLGLPRRSAPGRKPGRRLLDDNGLPTAQTTRTAPRVSTHTQAMPAQQTSLRICLMCLTKFESLGRHNRICSRCKGSSEYDSASSLPELHIPV